MTGNSKPKNKFPMLLKNDFLASSRVISLFYIIEVVALVVFTVSLRMQKEKPLAISSVASLGIAFLLIFVSFFFCIWDFNRALYTQQGYLSYSLPVTSNQMLGSKMIVYGGWMIVSYAVMMVVMMYVYRSLNNEYSETISMAEMMMQLLGLPSKEQIVGSVIYFFSFFFVLILSLVAMVYFAITLSHARAFQKHSVINAVIIFIVNLIVLCVGITLLEKVIDINLIVAGDGAVYLEFGKSDLEGTYYSFTALIYFIAQGVALFFGTSYIMGKKINIK